MKIKKNVLYRTVQESKNVLTTSGSSALASAEFELAVVVGHELHGAVANGAWANDEPRTCSQ